MARRRLRREYLSKEEAASFFFAEILMLPARPGA